MSTAQKSYYDILGVSESASEAEIKKAFRKLARQHHPDAGGDEETFKEINEAYETLSDDTKRKEYDTMRKYGGGFGGFGGAGASGYGNPGGYTYTTTTDWSDIFGSDGGAGGGWSSIFDRFRTSSASSQGSSQGQGFSGFGGFGGTGAQRATDGRDIQVQLEVSFEEAFSGVSKKVTVRVPDSKEKETVTVKVPAGAIDGARLRFREHGGLGSNGGKRGDLLVVIAIKEHPLYSRSGADVLMDLPISVAEAALGGQVVVPAPDGTMVKLRIPAGTPDGKTFVIKDKGAPKPKGKKADTSDGDFGALKVKVHLALPENLNKAQLEALEDFAAASDTTGADIRPQIAQLTANAQSKISQEQVTSSSQSSRRGKHAKKDGGED